VIDHAFSKEWAMTAREEMAKIHAQGILGASGNLLSTTAGEGHLLEKHHIYEKDLVLDGRLNPDTLSAWDVAPLLKRFVEHDAEVMVARFNAACPGLNLTGLDQLKVQLNLGHGGCFPMHYDTSTGSARELTAILYLNDEWTPEDGGELRLCPFPFENVDIPPVFNRLALFNSHQMLHRVMPSHAKERYALSLWFGTTSGTKESFPNRMPPPLEDDVDYDSLAVLREPETRKVLSKVLYAEQYAESFHDAFEEKDKVEESLTLHWQQVESAKAAVDPTLLAMCESTLPLKSRPLKPRIVGTEKQGATGSTALSGDEMMQLERKGAEARMNSRVEAAKKLRVEIGENGGAGVTVVELLQGLRLEGYAPTLLEYEYSTVAQLRAVGDNADLVELLEGLGVTLDDANRIGDVVLADEHGLTSLD